MVSSHVHRKVLLCVWWKKSTTCKKPSTIMKNAMSLMLAQYVLIVIPVHSILLKGRATFKESHSFILRPRNLKITIIKGNMFLNLDHYRKTNFIKKHPRKIKTCRSGAYCFTLFDIFTLRAHLVEWKCKQNIWYTYQLIGKYCWQSVLPTKIQINQNDIKLLTINRESF